MRTSVVVPPPAELAPFLPRAVACGLLSLPAAEWAAIEEIRMRAGQPVLVLSHLSQAYLGRAGNLTAARADAVVFSSSDAAQLMDLATESSAYALQEQLASGYLTLPGGHRLGIAGRAVQDGGRLIGIRDVGYFCLRLAREVRGAADRLLPAIIDRAAARVCSTLLVSPPRCGKTTVLRDAVRQLSAGLPRLGLPPQQIALVDERSEVAGSRNGVPTRDVGPCTDVMDACPKALGMFTMLRAMSPDVLATDEIGRPEDVGAIEEAARGGVAVLATAHAWGLDDLASRPATARLLAGGHFRRLAFLDRSSGPGTISRVCDGADAAAMCLPRGRVERRSRSAPATFGAAGRATS